MRRDWIFEVLAAAVPAALFPLICTNIKVNPEDRVGQVSGLASMDFRYTLIAIALVGLLIIAARWRDGAWFERASRYICAAVAGLATGIVAGGIVIALRGTPYALNGNFGDGVQLAEAAKLLMKGKDATSVYPPGFLHLLAWYSDLSDLHPLYALKHLQLAFTAMLGPAGYLAWRLLLRPTWALGIGLVAALPLIEGAPYKPYGVMVLMIFIPITIRFLQVLRHASDRHPWTLVRYGVGFGIAIGLSCLLYSGWFKWSAPGMFVAWLVLFPYAHWRRGLILTGCVFVVFGILAGSYLYTVFTHLKGLDDNFIYFDALLEPTYIAMWGGDLPPTTMWPPRGELAGLGVYTLLLVTGFGVAIALDRKRTHVIALASTIGGVWLIRFWYAHLMFKTKLVQLYPRTTAELVYCLLLMCGFAAFAVVERTRNKSEWLRSPSAVIGAVAALLLLFGSAGSNISDRYMPRLNIPMSFGQLAWNSHHSDPPE